MSYKSYALAFIAALVILPAFGQSKSFDNWKSEFDEKIFGSTRYRDYNNISLAVAAAYKSHAAGDMYYEGPTILMGLTFAWQATGDFFYLDLALDIIDADVEGNPLLSYYQGDPNSFFNTEMANKPRANSFFRNWPYKGSIMHSNWWEFRNLCSEGSCWGGTGNFSLADYVNNAPEPSNQNSRQFAYGGMVSSGNNGEPGGHLSLQENIYWRNVSNILRIMTNNTSILNLVSNNGKTYQERINYIADYLEVHIWQKWNDKEVDSKNRANNVYRVNTHMSSHLAMVALGLFKVTGKQEYFDFVQEFIWDFGSNPDSPDRIPNGWGFMDQLRIHPDGGYIWANSWTDMNSATDIGHAFAELQVLNAYYEEGWSAPPGEPALDAQFINRMVVMLENRIIDGYECSDGTNEPQLNNFLDGRGFQPGPVSSWAIFAQYSDRIHCYLEQNDHYDNKSEIGNKGLGMYLARLKGVNGISGPVYPTMGNGGGDAPNNNAPNVFLNGPAQINLTVGEQYTEQGARWNDIQDGSGDINTPTSGTVNTNQAGTYSLVYLYTDTGGLSDSATRLVVVSEPENNCPEVISTAGNYVRIEINGNYEEQGGTWTDVEDGSGTAEIGGDVVDTSTEGVYQVVYSYTDSAGCTESATLTVDVIDPNNVILIQEFFFDQPSLTIQVGQSVIPDFTIIPANPTTPFIWIQSSDQELATVDPNGYITALAAGTITVTGRTLDGSDITDTMTIEITDDNILLQSFNWDQPTYTIEVGQRALPPFTIFPENATKPYIWVRSSDNSIATVDGNGFLTGVSAGTITVTGQSLDGTNLVDTMILEVVEESLPTVSANNQVTTEGQDLNFQFVLSKAYSQGITLSVDYQDISTTSADYSINTQEIVFDGDDTEQTLRISTNQDFDVEGPESLRITVTANSPENLFGGEPLVLTGTINDDDGAQPLPEIQVFPNPATSASRINIVGLNPGSYEFSLYSISGRRLQTAMLDMNGGQDLYELPNLGKGLYILNITNLQGTITAKIAVQ